MVGPLSKRSTRFATVPCHSDVVGRARPYGYKHAGPSGPVTNVADHPYKQPHGSRGYQCSTGERTSIQIRSCLSSEFAV
jgi:hypothetical protein